MFLLSFFARLLLVLNGLNACFVTFFTGYNQFITQLSTTRPLIVYLFVGAVGLASLMFLFDRNYYLPFLGPCVIPIPKSTESIEKSSTSVKLTDLPPNARVVYWGAMESKSDFGSYKDAYGDYTNSGTVDTNKDGEAVINISCPGRYSVKKFGVLQSQLPRHVHYRYEIPDNKGLYSEVFTRNVDC